MTAKEQVIEAEEMETMPDSTVPFGRLMYAVEPLRVYEQGFSSPAM
ncbi:MAG: hypothetical protein J6Y79_04480 [Paludibacteraceae bacterium]|nr:hypothetical protein [Paludibacteraceae bacterium]